MSFVSRRFPLAKASTFISPILLQEMAWKIADGEVPKEQVPEDIYDSILGMDIKSAPDFTQYPEGSPNHPSWPAMHSAASSASLWLAVVADLTDEQYCQVLRTDHSVAYARTVAGVHYPGDNIAGLNMGQNGKFRRPAAR